MLDHFYRSVPGWAAFAQLYIETVRAAPSDRPLHYVEIGSWLGRSAVLMAVEIANSGKNIRFDCVDPWTDGGPDLRHKVAKMQEPIYEQFLRNISPVRQYINPVRLPSLEAAKTYEDNSLDLVLIDGSHQYEDVRADIAAWLPKMRPGATFAGDDMNWPGVARAVYEQFDKERVEVRRLHPKHRPDRPNPKYWIVQL